MNNAHLSKRRSPRLDVMGLVAATIGQPASSVVLKDISLEGCGFEASRALARGSRHTMCFTAPSGESVALRAEILTSRLLSSSDGPPRYLVGVRFMTEDGAAKRAVEWLIDTVTSPLTFL